MRRNIYVLGSVTAEEMKMKDAGTEEWGAVSFSTGSFWLDLKDLIIASVCGCDAEYPVKTFLWATFSGNQIAVSLA